VGKTVFKREMLHNLYSLRFFLSLVIVLAVFSAGSLSYVRHHRASLDKYGEARELALKRIREDASRNATWLAVTRRSFDLRPRDNAFMDEAKEKYLPTAIIFSAWNVFGFENKGGRANPWLARYDELTWAFVAALLVSFIALLFTFDAISGEKESKTLSLALANAVPRSALLAGKYASAVVSVLAIVVVGLAASLLILAAAGEVEMNGTLALEALAFAAAAGLLAAAMAAFGILCSVLTRHSNVSLLLALCVWLLFAVVIPNSSGFVAQNLLAIEKAESVQKRVNQAFDDLNKAAPPGSWMMVSGYPALPQHELRANLQRKRLAAEKAIRDDYFRSMFRQFERTRKLTAVSPVASFGYLAEAVVGGGYARFRKTWDDIHVYQAQFQDFFTSLDARDPKSPHWYNPSEDVSTTREKVGFETVPQFVEKPIPLEDRLRFGLPYLLILAVLTGLVSGLSYALFVRYDVR
jgi:ABC-type transport system involved in multi-copper enzyme maturation permease subunit